MFDYKKKKDDPAMSPMEQEAKMKVLGGMKDEADGDLLGKLQGLQKVSVASNDAEGLAAGLDKAKQMLGGQGDNPLEEMTEQMSPEELQALIDHLLEKKKILEQKGIFKPQM